ncbi:MAG: hypothetical protein JWP89_4775 [Schlesneria sp.]|nr:hypothetical protein [Schlesneria sp.]
MGFGTAGRDQVAEITRVLWSYPQLDGPYLDRHREPESQERFDLTDYGQDGFESLLGILKTWDGHEVPFTQSTVVDDDGLWVYAGPPLGGLPVSWDVGAYPFDDGKPADWLLPLVEQLGELSEYVHRRCPMLAATYGWLTVLDVDIVVDAIVGKIPDERWCAIRTWKGSESTYYPRNQPHAPLRFDLPLDQEIP